MLNKTKNTLLRTLLQTHTVQEWIAGHCVWLLYIVFASPVKPFNANNKSASKRLDKITQCCEIQKANQ